jgi:colanic acid/amylovoran biosynthesis protein
VPQNTPGLSVAMFGVPGASLNLGVGALRESAVVGLLSRQPDARLTVFDDGWGVRPAEVVVDGLVRPFEVCGVRNSRRVHKRESYLNMQLSALVGGAGNRGLQVVDQAAAVWDVSGGDSFSDIYGAQRFNTVTLPKELALRRRRPLLLLPQTYGPFKDRKVRERARRVITGSTQAWARDGDSFAALKDLLGPDFTPDRHRLGVDLAFGLVPAAPSSEIADQVDSDLAAFAGRPVVGLNVSGLLLNEAQAADKYGLALDYRRVVWDLADRLMNRSDAALVLVPHVLGSPGSTDSDDDVTNELFEHLGTAHPGRVLLAPRALGPGGRKWLIARLDWFTGARMHATIAALSSGVPTAPLAYSLKFKGVFDSCGQADQVVDARYLGTGDAIERLWASWEERDAVRRRLREGLPPVLVKARAQMDDIVATSCDLATVGAGGMA